jgi:hypothetical protein
MTNTHEIVIQLFLKRNRMMTWEIYYHDLINSTKRLDQKIFRIDETVYLLTDIIGF